MNSFKAFDESLFNEFRSSTKEGLDDITANEEEIDKIEFEISESRARTPLRVDYSDFSNHVFFGSGLAAVNFALSRLLNDYPFDGELKEKNEWKRVNSGYENYFYEQYPKQQGYLEIFSGASVNWVEVDDYENKLQIGTGSFAVDCVVLPRLTSTDTLSSLFAYYDEINGNTGIYALFSSSNEFVFSMNSGGLESLVLYDYTPYISESHALSFVYNRDTDLQGIYVDGELVASTSISASFSGYPSEIIVPSQKLYIGAGTGSGVFNFHFSGAVDDFRVWVGPGRSSELIKRNFFRPVHANISGGLKLYYKFNETDMVGTTAVDYSGNELHGTHTGSFTFSQNIVSGTLGSWFKDNGDIITDLTNTRVTGFLDTQRASGTLYDKENRNYIFKLVPSFFIDEGDEHEDMQLFLLLMARHYDRLKLYIEHLANIYNIDQGDYNNTPDELIGLVAKHYGLDLGDVYEGASALEYFFGEGVIPTGSIESIESIRNQLRRNLLSNLTYIIKTKSTRQALEVSLRSLGLDEEVVNINEYSAFSGGITTSRTPRTVERRVLRSTGSVKVDLTSSIYTASVPRTYQVRALFNTASVQLTSSVFSIVSGSEELFHLKAIRDNLTGTQGKIVLSHASVGEETTLQTTFLTSTLPSWMNLERASPGTYHTANTSSLGYAGQNQARFENLGDTSGSALLLEKDTINILSGTQDLNSSDWSMFNGSLTGNYSAPILSGTEAASASLINNDANSNARIQAAAQYFKVNTIGCTSVFLRLGSPDGLLRINNPDKTNQTQMTNVEASASWNRVYGASPTVSGTFDNRSRFLVYNRDAVARSFEIWGAQHEEDTTYPTSYVHALTGTMSRSADVCWCSSAVAPAGLGRDGTVSTRFRFRPIWSTANVTTQQTGSIQEFYRTICSWNEDERLILYATASECNVRFISSSFILSSSNLSFNNHQWLEVDLQVNRFETRLEVASASVGDGIVSSSLDARVHAGNVIWIGSTTGSQDFIDGAIQSVEVAAIPPQLTASVSGALYDNQWVNLSAIKPTITGTLELRVGYLGYDDLDFYESSSVSSSAFLVPSILETNFTASLATGSGGYFDGYLQEFRVWDRALSSSIVKNHFLDFESLAVEDFADDIDSLVVHLKLNDFTSSVAGTAPAHDYVNGATGSIYSGLSSSAVYNFPGKYIDKLEPSYSYDFGINNDKIRIREDSNFDIRDIVPDIPYLSVDMSPAVSLNREIIRWFGDLEQFNNIVGIPYLRYREELDTLNDYRTRFFSEKLNSKIDFQAYLNLIKWFDSNFTFFLNQLLPLDLGSSLSNFVIESHLLEHNQVPRVFPFNKGDGSLEITGAVDARGVLEVALQGEDIPLGDPGRFGSAVSASANVVTTEDFVLFTSASLSGARGVNFQREDDREIFTDLLQENSHSHSPNGYGNGWYTLVVTGSNYLKNVLNVDSTFHISGVHFLTGAVHGGVSDGVSSLYLTAAHGKPLNTNYTGAINGVQDSTWLWYYENEFTLQDAIGPKWSYGIGYGGVWGQLPFFNNRGRRATTLDLKYDEGLAFFGDDLVVGLGGGIEEDFATDVFVKVREETDDTKTFILWPHINAFEPVRIENSGSGGSISDTTGSIYPIGILQNDVYGQTGELGGDLPKIQHADTWSDDFVPIEGFRHVDVAIIAKRKYGSPDQNKNGIRLVVRFQFFNNDLGGIEDSEGAMSSSFIVGDGANRADKYISKKIDHEYVFEKIPQASFNNVVTSHDFIIHFEKELPKAKFMKTFVRVEFPYVTGSQMGYNMIVKGTLHEETTDVQSKLLGERRT